MLLRVFLGYVVLAQVGVLGTKIHPARKEAEEFLGKFYKQKYVNTNAIYIYIYIYIYLHMYIYI